MSNYEYNLSFHKKQEMTKFDRTRCLPSAIEEADISRMNHHQSALVGFFALACWKRTQYFRTIIQKLHQLIEFREPVFNFEIGTHTCLINKDNQQSSSDTVDGELGTYRHAYSPIDYDASNNDADEKNGNDHHSSSAYSEKT